MAATGLPLLEDPHQLERFAGFTIEAQLKEEFYLCRSQVLQVPADIPHGTSPKW